MKKEDRPIELLLIDDDELSREVLTLQMTAQGYAVETAESGDAAVLRLERSGPPFPHAVLTDLRMPGLCGMALARRLRSIVNAAGAPRMVLLAMSASKPDEDLNGGYDSFLLKPFTMKELAEALVRKPGRISGSWRIPTETAMSDSHAPVLVADLSGSLDEDVYQRLAASMSPARLREFYAFCLDDAEARIGRMRVAAAAGDDAEYRKEAHTIKGSCSMVGAVELQQLAAAEEARGNNPANHVASLDEMLDACARLRRILIARTDRAIK